MVWWRLKGNATGVKAMEPPTPGGKLSSNYSVVSCEAKTIREGELCLMLSIYVSVCLYMYVCMHVCIYVYVY